MEVAGVYAGAARAEGGGGRAGGAGKVEGRVAAAIEGINGSALAVQPLRRVQLGLAARQVERRPLLHVARVDVGARGEGRLGELRRASD